MRVCLCCPSHRVLWPPCRSFWFFIGATRVPSNLKNNPRGRGRGLHFRAFPSWFPSVAFVLRMWVCKWASCARCDLTNRRGHTHEGGHGPISSSFSWFSSCPGPAPKSAAAPPTTQKSSFMHMWPRAIKQQDKTRRCKYDSLCSLIQWFQSCRCLVLSYFTFLTLINLHPRQTHNCIDF